jgi:hypothetical protein
MLRAGLNNVVKRSILKASSSSSKSLHPLSSIQTFHYHSTRSNEKATADSDKQMVVKGDSGLLGTGIPPFYAIPAAMVFAVPAIKFEWLTIDAEFQLAAVFITFCYAFYRNAGDAVYNALKSDGDAILKDHNEAEDKVLAAMEEKLALLKGSGDMVHNFEAINSIREETYENLNAAGKVKPLHDFKAQMEKVLNMICVEEASVQEKAKVALLNEATESVTNDFNTNKQLKKTALDAAIATLKGSKGKATADPVKDAFVAFFKNKKASAAKADTAAEETSERAALIAKLNSVAKNEGFLFQFDSNGMPKMNA